MRVIAGSARGRRLAAPPGSDTRPTADRVREALFSILGPPPASAVVLDLFAGAGTLGIEALSRGAERAVFADHARAAARVLRKNLDELGLAGRAEVHVGDATRFAQRLGREGRSFSWIFLDPPYAAGLADAALAAIAAGRLLAPDGTLVVEHDRRASPQAEHGLLIKADCRRYGDTELTFYRINDHER
jgi:16S rRNA (guanine(966)-N(2))-methyltransferase RsmD